MDKEQQTPETCAHDCSHCSANCGERKAKRGEFFVAPNQNSRIRKVIAVVSGKGGVGKSLVTGMAAVNMNRRGYAVGVLDADVTGPSVPKMFGLKEKALGDENGLYPVKSATGVKVMSVNLLLDDDAEPVVWRGPVISGAVQQFWTDVIWEDVDYMFVDMPPGTGDVPLTVFQSLPVDGILIVTSPQELVSMIVEKAVRMAGKMDVPVLGIVENYSYAICPKCGDKLRLFGEGAGKTAERLGIPLLAEIPLDPKLAAACDAGLIENYAGDYLDKACDVLEKLSEKK